MTERERVEMQREAYIEGVNALRWRLPWDTDNASYGEALNDVDRLYPLPPADATA